MTTAIVLGGGFAGVLAANVLARHADDVVVVEGDRYPVGPGVRSGLPQAHHNHVLVTGGARALDALLPGTVDALLAHGAHRRGLPGDALILSADGWFRRRATDAYLIACSRWLTDHVVRERALAPDVARGAVSVRERTRVLGLVGDASRVTGAVLGLEDGRELTLRADIVVDATGRRSRAGRWLSAIGGPPVEEETVDSGLVYSTRVYRAPAGLAAEIPAVMVHPSPDNGRPGHGATLFPIEGDRWIVTLTGTRGCEPPIDEQGFTDCAYALRSPVIAELMAAAKPAGGVRPYGGTKNRRRYFERRPRPDGLLVFGDALVAVNPVHSHGMSIAAMSALRLDGELTRLGTDPSVFPALQAAMADVADRSWRMAIEQDRVHTGPSPEASPFEQRVRARTARAVLNSPVLMAELFRAQTLIPSQAAVDPSFLRELSLDPGLPLSTDQAIAQYPGLSEWWLSGRPAAPTIVARRRP
jgi:flavin-dependent dehydrogenase